jgi:hypothetical protein
MLRAEVRCFRCICPKRLKSRSLFEEIQRLVLDGIDADPGNSDGRVRPLRCQFGPSDQSSSMKKLTLRLVEGGTAVTDAVRS